MGQRYSKMNFKVAFLIDNCTVHIQLKNLKHIKIALLSPNTTSVLRPMDQLLNLNLKFHIRNRFVMHILENYENDKEYSIFFLIAIILLSKSWRLVTAIVIRSCF